MDTLSRERRSALMARVKARDTKPELKVRRLLHALGYRFRLHRKDLPGKPDMVFSKHRLCLLVHGCFWHHHKGCKGGTIPQSNREFWMSKFDKNRARDERVLSALEQAGWRVFVIWECETKYRRALMESLGRCFGDDPRFRHAREKPNQRSPPPSKRPDSTARSRRAAPI